LSNFTSATHIFSDNTSEHRMVGNKKEQGYLNAKYLKNRIYFLPFHTIYFLFEWILSNLFPYSFFCQIFLSERMLAHITPDTLWFHIVVVLRGQVCNCSSSTKVVFLYLKNKTTTTTTKITTTKKHANLYNLLMNQAVIRLNHVIFYKDMNKYEMLAYLSLIYNQR
jgi:hypothetical protein